MSESIMLRLTKEEALVFFELLAKLETFHEKIELHSSDEKVIWKLEGQLEKILVEPFMKNYVEILAEARRAIDGNIA